MLHAPLGPDKPPPLVTIGAARHRRMTLDIRCKPCNRNVRVPSACLPPVRRSVTIGELWLAGRFRCGECRQPATRVAVVVTDATHTEIERWAVGEPFVAEKLRRHWRWDRYDRRDWGAWFGR